MATMKALASSKGALNEEGVGSTWILTAIAHHFGNDGVKKTTDAISKARAAGVPWLKILTTILPLILSLFSGGGISLQAIIDAILALVKQPAPGPVTP
jgi:hypothetical protein